MVTCMETATSAQQRRAVSLPHSACAAFMIRLPKLTILVLAAHRCSHSYELDIPRHDQLTVCFLSHRKEPGRPRFSNWPAFGFYSFEQGPSLCKVRRLKGLDEKEVVRSGPKTIIVLTFAVPHSVQSTVKPDLREMDHQTIY